jgi:hypothetical protein
MTLDEVSYMKLTTRTALGLLAGLALVAATGCGMRPPADFHEAADVDDVNLDPMPEPPEPAAPTDAGVDPDAGEQAPPPDTELAELPVAVGMTAIPTLTVSALLGKTREDVEALLDPIGPEDPDDPEGWIRYSDHLKLKFAEEIVVELIQEVPEGKTCLEAARWLGFGDAKEPTEAADGCRWSEGALGPGTGGELLQKTGLFRAWKKK